MKRLTSIVLCVTTLVAAIFFYVQTMTFRFESLPGADVKAGIHALSPTSVCRGVALPLGSYRVCIGLTGQYYE